MKVVLVAGTRPNFIKIAPLLEAAGEHPELDVVLVHTGQHYNYEMSRSFFDQLGIREPDIFLEVGSGKHGEQTARVMIGFEEVLAGIKPEMVVVVGDVNSTLACALAAAKINYDDGTGRGPRRPLIAHVEAGLRSFDRSMPEEINRLITDSLSDYLFTTCEDANVNLFREGASEDKIYFVGNVMIDTLLANIGSFEMPPFLKGRAGDYVLLTLHRPGNVDNRDNLRVILEALHAIAGDIPVIFPAHPRTRKKLKMFGLESSLSFPQDHTSLGRGGVYLINPLPYFEFMGAMKNAKMVLTDSGGIQEETTVLGIPCLTLRDNTERPITVEIGTNTIVGTSKERIVEEARNIMQGIVKKPRVPDLWDGHTANRILKIIVGSAS